MFIELVDNLMMTTLDVVSVPLCWLAKDQPKPIRAVAFVLSYTVLLPWVIVIYTITFIVAVIIALTTSTIDCVREWWLNV